MRELLESVERLVDWAIVTLQGWPLWGKVVAFVVVLTPILTFIIRALGLY
jgi:hypothetical protein